MRVAVAFDHAGYPLKALVVETVRSLGHELIDLGTDSEESVDYPEYALKLGELIRSGQAQRGILICGSGVGASIAANKIKGVYAGLCHDSYSAHQGVEHDDMNVLCLGSRVIGVEIAREIIINYLHATFTKDERHVRRVGKVRSIEETGKINNITDG